jgi:hypothetical protein
MVGVTLFIKLSETSINFVDLYSLEQVWVLEKLFEFRLVKLPTVCSLFNPVST